MTSVKFLLALYLSQHGLTRVNLILGSSNQSKRFEGTLQVVPGSWARNWPLSSCSSFVRAHLVDGEPCGKDSTSRFPLVRVFAEEQRFLTLRVMESFESMYNTFVCIFVDGGAKAFIRVFGKTHDLNG